MIGETILILIVVAALCLPREDREAGALFGSTFLIYEIFFTGSPIYVYYLSGILVCGFIIEAISKVRSEYVQTLKNLTLVIFFLSVAGWIVGWCFRSPVILIDRLSLALLLFALLITIQRGLTHGRRSARSWRRFADFVRGPSDCLDDS